MSINPTRAVSGAVITTAMYNQLVDVIMTPPLCRLQKASAQSTSGSPNTNTAIAFDQETYDAYAMHDTSSNTTRITIPAGWGGYYSAIGGARNANPGTPSLLLQFAVNGTVISNSAQRAFGTAGTGAICRTTDDMLLAAGDYVELWVQSDTASISLAPGNCMFALKFIHP